jgi:23S rRNA (adenine2503-C2)-methyltransferase
MDFLENFEKAFSGQPSFRLKQAKKAIFQDLLEDWKQVRVLPLALRMKLVRTCPLAIEAKTFASDDGRTVRAVITLKDGLKVETVLMRYKDRNTVCVSSMLGCPLACCFCATGKMGFKRNLSPGEIVEQVLFFKRYLKGVRLPCGVVFMGMGEPFLNYDNVLAAVGILNDKEGFNIGARHISISTVGIVQGIEKLARESLQANLALSLHAPNNELRTRLMPVNQQEPLDRVLAAVQNYMVQTRRRVMFEYIMIKEVNDSLVLARELAQILSRFKKSLCLVNLIQYNPTGIFKASERAQIQRFKEVLERQGFKVTERYRFGREVGAACGQLALRA